MSSAVVRAYRGVITYRGTPIIIIISSLALVLAACAIFGPELVRQYWDNKDRQQEQSFNTAVDARISAKLDPLGTKLDTLTESVTQIGTKLDTLQPFIEDLVKRQMGVAATLPLPQFQANLSQIENAVIAARIQHVFVDAATTRTVGEKLSTLLTANTATLQVWTASSELASYRSEVQNPGLNESTQPDCRSTAPTASSNIGEVLKYTLTHRDMPETKITPWVYSNCRFNLADFTALIESQPHLEVQNPTMPHTDLIAPYVFESAVIYYDGKQPLPPSNLEFRNCVFHLALQPDSNARMRMLVAALLTSDPAKVEVPKA
jgi:hypothetical protein